MLSAMLGQQEAPVIADEQGRWSGGTQLTRGVVWAVAGAVLILTCVLVLGTPSALVVAGAWSLAWGFSRLGPGLSGPVCWAAGAVAEIGVVAALSFGLALVSPREHGQATALAILTTPVLVGLVMVGLVAIARRSFPVKALRPARPAVPWAIALAAFAVTAWEFGKGAGYDVAWALSGDGRNHVLEIRGVIADGGLTLTRLRAFPSLLHGLSALMSTAGGRNLPPGSLFLHDARAMADTYVLAALAIATLLAAALLELLPAAVAISRRLPLAVIPALLGCAAVSVSSLALGTSLLDGFFGTYVTIPLALAAVVLAIRCGSEPSPLAFALLGPALVLTLMGWTVLAVAPLMATLTVTAALVLTHDRRSAVWGNKLGWGVAGAITLGCVLVTVVAVLTQYASLKSQFLVPGPPPTPIEHWAIYILALVALGGLAGARSIRQAVPWAAALAVAVGTIVVVQWQRSLTPSGDDWTYYAAKTLWALTICLVWVPFAPIVMATGRPIGNVPHRALRLGGALAQSSALTLAVVMAFGFTTTVPDPLHLIGKGWLQPSTAVLNQAVKSGDQGHPFVLWNWKYTGDDRLGNFLAAAILGSSAKGVSGSPQAAAVYSWAYTDVGQPRQLCALARSVKGLYVVTADRALQGQMRKVCPQSGLHFVLTEKPS